MADLDDDARPGPDGRRRRAPPTIEGQAVEIRSSMRRPRPSASHRRRPDAAAMTEPKASVAEHAAATTAPDQAAEPAMAQSAAEPLAAEPETPAAKPATSVPGIAAPPGRTCRRPPNSNEAPHSVPPRPVKARTPWFAIFASGIVGAGLTAVAAGAAWIYGAPLLEPDTSSLNARLTRLEMHTPTAAEIAAATVPDMGKVSAAKIDELAARLTKLEAAETAGARQAPVADNAKVDDLAARLTKLEAAETAGARQAPAADTVEARRSRHAGIAARKHAATGEPACGRCRRAQGAWHTRRRGGNDDEADRRAPRRDRAPGRRQCQGGARREQPRRDRRQGDGRGNDRSTPTRKNRTKERERRWRASPGASVRSKPR